MGNYTVTGRSSLAGGQPEDVSQVLANLDLIAAVLNGGIDNSNIAPAAGIAKSKLAALAIANADIDPAAAIAASKLAGYPADATKVLKGDGTWGAVVPTVYRKVTPKAVNTTIAATDLLNGEITVGAGAMGLSGLLRLTLIGDWLQTSGGAAAPPRFQVVLGGVTIFDTGTSGTISSAATRYGWRLQAEILNLGAANAQASTMRMDLTTPNGTATQVSSPFTTGAGYYIGIPSNTFTNSGNLLAEGVNTATAVDTSTAKLLSVNVINASASASYETKLYGAVVEVV